MSRAGTTKTRLEDVAAAAGVSIATVSRALNNSPAVNPETKRRIWKVAREQNYKFRPSMPAVLSDASATLTIVTAAPATHQARIRDPFLQELIGGVGEAARELGCDVLLSNLLLNKDEDLLSHMLSNRSDGFIFFGQDFLHEDFNTLAETEKKFIVWGAELPGQKYCAIGSDNVRGGIRATTHLINLGRRRIAFIGDMGSAEMVHRRSGYVAAHERAGIEVDAALTVTASYEIESAEAALNTLLERGIPFDGVFAANDLIAMGAVRGLLAAGRKIPDDVSVIGYDDLQLSSYAKPALTTISQDVAKAGRIMVSKLMNADPNGTIRSERLSTDLIVRESCGLV